MHQLSIPVIAFSAFALLSSNALPQGQVPNAAAPTTQSATPRALVAKGFDPRQLVGEWEGYLVNDDGSRPSQRTGNMTLIITADKISTKAQGNQGEGTYRVSAGEGQFHHIDATGTAGHYDGKVYPGIFTLEGDTLKWCSGEAGWARPTELKTKFSEGRYLMILTRKQ